MENKIELTLNLTDEEWAVIRKALFTQSEKEESEAIDYRDRAKRYEDTAFYSNYAKIHAERYMIIKEAKQKIDDAFSAGMDTYWHNIENDGDASIKQRLGITDDE